jgi:hypothetical protein
MYWHQDLRQACHLESRLRHFRDCDSLYDRAGIHIGAVDAWRRRGPSFDNHDRLLQHYRARRPRPRLTTASAFVLCYVSLCTSATTDPFTDPLDDKQNNKHPLYSLAGHANITWCGRSTRRTGGTWPTLLLSTSKTSPLTTGIVCSQRESIVCTSNYDTSDIICLYPHTGTDGEVSDDAASNDGILILRVVIR